LENLLQFSDDLDAADRLEISEKLAVLAAPDQPERERVAAGNRIKAIAPKAWTLAVPMVQSLVGAEIRKHLGLPPV
jgi:hypothetical protein